MTELSDFNFEDHFFQDFTKEWADHIHAWEGKRNEFLRRLVYEDDVVRAVDAFRTLFSGRSQEVLNQALAVDVYGHTVLGSWASAGGWEERTDSASALLAAAQALGANMGHEYEVTLPGETAAVKGTDVGIMMARSAIDSKPWRIKAEMDSVELLMAHGASTDQLFRHTLLKFDDLNLSRQWFDLAHRHTGLLASEVIRGKDLERANPEAVAYFSALAAHEGMKETTGKGLRPLPG